MGHSSGVHKRNVGVFFCIIELSFYLNFPFLQQLKLNFIHITVNLIIEWVSPSPPQ